MVKTCPDPCLSKAIDGPLWLCTRLYWHILSWCAVVCVFFEWLWYKTGMKDLYLLSVLLSRLFSSGSLGVPHFSEPVDVHTWRRECGCQEGAFVKRIKSRATSRVDATAHSRANDADEESVGRAEMGMIGRRIITVYSALLQKPRQCLMGVRPFQLPNVEPLCEVCAAVHCNVRCLNLT